MQKEEDVPVTSPAVNLKVRKTLKGHRGRILHFDWSPDKYHVVTAGQVPVCVCVCVCVCICVCEAVFFWKGSVEGLSFYHTHSLSLSLLKDGQLFLWNGMTAQKEMVVQSSKWVCACSFSPSTTLLACA